MDGIQFKLIDDGGMCRRSGGEFQGVEGWMAANWVQGQRVKGFNSQPGGRKEQAIACKIIDLVANGLTREGILAGLLRALGEPDPVSGGASERSGTVAESEELVDAGVKAAG